MTLPNSYNSNSCHYGDGNQEDAEVLNFSSWKLSECTFIIDKKRNSRCCLFERLSLWGAMVIGVRFAVIAVLSKTKELHISLTLVSLLV